MTHARAKNMGKNTILSAAVLLTAATGCSEFEVENKAPIARAKVLVNGTQVSQGGLVPFPGSDVTVTLDGSESSDPDGHIQSYLWVRTDLPPKERYAGNGLFDAGGLPPYAGDPPPQPRADVALGEGEYRFSLWVTDDEGRISEPASVSFEVGVPYMPDMACLDTYPNPNPDCEECVCSPSAMGGCLDQYTACYGNADPMFVTLCSAVVSCALEKRCTGSACYTGGCMAEIDAAAGYMGGTLADCQGDPAANPCAAASQLGACSGAMGACASACN